jgi:hypothetical protein
MLGGVLLVLHPRKLRGKMLYRLAMSDSGSPSAGVTAAGIVAILGSVLTVIGVLMGLAGLLLVPSLGGAPQIPFFARTLAIVMMCAFLGVAVFGIFAGVGLLRLKNWARIATLVWAGIAAPFSALILLFFLLIPIPEAPNTPVNIRILTRVFAALFYVIPLAIGLWWLIFFTRKGVVAQFKAISSRDAGLDPTTSPSAQLAPARPGTPLPITVVAWFFLFSSLSLVIVSFMHLPAVLFGVAIQGLAGIVVWATWCAIYVTVGVGLLRRFSWSLPMSVGVQAFGLLSGGVALLSPGYEVLMQQMMASMDMPNSAYALPTTATMRHLQWLSLVLPFVVLLVLIYYRARFLEACSASVRS